MSAVTDLILEEGQLCRVNGQGRRVFRVTTIYLTRGTFDAVDQAGRLRTFLTTEALPAKAGDVGPARGGAAAPNRARGRR